MFDSGGVNYKLKSSKLSYSNNYISRNNYSTAIQFIQNGRLDLTTKQFSSHLVAAYFRRLPTFCPSLRYLYCEQGILLEHTPKETSGIL